MKHCCLQVKVQEKARDVEAHSNGGAITCMLPPSLGAISAVLEPRSSVTLGDGVRFEVNMLHFLIQSVQLSVQLTMYMGTKGACQNIVCFWA